MSAASKKTEVNSCWRVLCVMSDFFLPAVSLSGGCDSVALLWLAKNEFSTVTAITVNHK